MDDLGDRMPSVLINEMLSLLDGHQPCMLFEWIFVNQMPDSIRLHLADADFTDSRKIAEKADELWLAMSMSSSSYINKAMRTWRHIKEKVPSSTKEIVKNNAECCFYHNRIGDKARKCLQPCKFPRKLPG